MKICCISLKYSKPDIFSELVSFGQEAEKCGHTVSYIFSKHCQWLVEEFPGSLDVFYLGQSIDSKSMFVDTFIFFTFKYKHIKRLFKHLQCDILFFGNMHPANKIIANAAKKSGCKKIWWWLHEPYRENKEKYGWWQKYYYALAEFFQPGFLNITNLVVLSSKEAVKVFKKHYSGYHGKLIQAPLILKDYFEPDSNIEPKYITFVGTAVHAKGVDIFFDLLEYAALKNLPLEFQIITPTDISRLTRFLSQTAKAKLKIISSPAISDRMLGQAVRNSLAVLTPYRSTMQSGVVPVAFMHGVPVITTDVGSMSEFVRPGETGFLIQPNASFSDWLYLITKIKEKRTETGKICRKWYEAHHSPEKWHSLFPKMFR